MRVRMSRIFEAALVYANVSPPEITSTDPIKVSCQSIAIASPRILLASRAPLTGSEHGESQMPPYATLGLAARKALPGSRAARRVSIRPHAGWTGAPSCSSGYAQCAAETRTPGSSAAGNPAAGFSCLTARAALGTAKRQFDENSRNEHLAGVRLMSSSCGSCPTLLPALMRGLRGSPCLAHLGPITIPVQDSK